MAFEDLGLHDWLTKQCNVMGIIKPTAIQNNCIPHVLKGEDCIGCAKTGSGKTAAFALPILQKLSEDPFGIFALVLTPTRELAFQISEQFSVLGKPIGVRVSVITGGLDMMQQGLDLSVKPHIVISTPGRLADHLESCDTFSLRRIKFLVLDEADRLIEDDYGEQLETIFKVLPRKRQTLLFSATMTQTLQQLQEVALNKPFFWQQPSEVATVEELKQYYVLMSADVKDAYMMHVLDMYCEAHPKSSIIIFTSTCKYTQLLGMVCQELGFDCVVLHSLIRQKERLAALAKFKSNQVKILVATDVASRGLDIPTVDLIINHNIPNKPKNYIHRVGRTARAGRGGTSVSLVTQFDIKLVHAVEAIINTKLEEYPTHEREVMKILTEVAVARREAEIRLDERDFGQQKETNKRKKLIAEGKDPEEEERKRLRLIKQKFRKHRSKMQEKEEKMRQNASETLPDPVPVDKGKRPLKAKDPLNAKDPLKAKEPVIAKDHLNAKDPLKVKEHMKAKDPLKAKEHLKAKDPLKVKELLTTKEHLRAKGHVNRKGEETMGSNKKLKRTSEIGKKEKTLQAVDSVKCKTKNVLKQKLKNKSSVKIK